ncbi:MAG: hypothetical protein AB8H80_15145 [Planctomycetota bacterium]
MLLMARAGKPAECQAALEAAHAAGADERMAGAVYGWRVANDHDIIEMSLAWLARNARVAHRMIAQLASDNVDDECDLIVSQYIRSPCRGAAHEAIVWIRTAYDTEARRLQRLADGTPRYVAHALAELVRDDAAGLATKTSVLLELARTPSAAIRERFGRRIYRMRRNWLFGFDRQIQKLALLALATSGELPHHDERLAELVEEHFGVAIDKLAARIREERRSGKLAQSLQQIEHECRTAAAAAPELIWPCGREHAR